MGKIDVIPTVSTMYQALERFGEISNYKNDDIWVCVGGRVTNTLEKDSESEYYQSTV